MIENQEQSYKKTVEYEAELKTKTQLTKAVAKANRRIKHKCMKHDLIVNKLKMVAKEKRHGFEGLGLRVAFLWMKLMSSCKVEKQMGYLRTNPIMR